MGRVTADMSMSLDGFITAPRDTRDQPLGEGGEVLHRWIFKDLGGGSVRDVPAIADAFAAMGAMVMGRHSFEVAEDAWGSDPPFRVPVFVLTHHPRDTQVRGETSFIFSASGFEATLERAKEAAGGSDVALHGATPVQQALRAGLLDELQIHLVPVLLGGGRRLFENHVDGQVQLETIRVADDPGVTHVRYRVVR